MNGKRKTLVDIVEGFIYPEKKGMNIDELQEEEEKELIREYKRMKLKELLARKKKELEELEADFNPPFKTQVSQSQGNPQNIATALVSSLIAQGMKPEEVDEYIKKLSPETLAALNAVATNNPMYAILMAQMTRNNPQQLTAKDVIEIVERLRNNPQINIVDLIKVIGEMKKSEGGGSAVELFDRLVKPLMEENYRTKLEILEREIARLQNRPSFLEELTQKRDEVEALKALFGGGSERKEDLEHKKLLLDFEKWKTEKMFEMEKWKMEQGLQRQKIDTVISKLLAPFMARAIPILNELTKVGKAKVAGIRSPPVMPSIPQQTSIPTQGNMIMLKCEKCGSLIPVNARELPETINCLQCGATYTRKRTQKKKEEVIKEEPKVEVIKKVEQQNSKSSNKGSGNTNNT